MPGAWYVLNKNMTIKLREIPVQQRKPRGGETTAVVVEVIPDVFTDLWIRHGDGSWRWVDLTFLAEREVFRSLRDPKIFQQARISRSRRVVEWPGGLRLSTTALAGTPNELNAEDVYVRATSDTAFGWFRPLTVSVPRWVQRRHLPDEVRVANLNDAEVLEWLGFPKAQLQRVISAYAGGEEVITARLLDLVMCLSEPNRLDVITLRQWLKRPWKISSHLTPEEAIERGQIAYVERLLTAKSIWTKTLQRANEKTLQLVNNKTAMEGL